jgi:hypothetical protein
LVHNFLRATAKSIDVDYGQISIAPQFGIRDEQIHHLGMSLHYELKDMNVVGRLYADCLAKVLAIQLVSRYSYLNDFQMNRGGMAPRKLRKATAFINENLDNEETIASTVIAPVVQMSYSHFSRAFKQSMGVTPNGYMTELRIERAKSCYRKQICQSPTSHCGAALQARVISLPLFGDWPGRRQ